MKVQRYWIIALLSLTLVGMELTWTRVFSAEFFYTFAFLILSLAVMGLGMGALAVRLFGRLNREYWLGLSLFLAGALSFSGPPLVFALGLDFSVAFARFDMMLLVLLTVLILASPYFFGGIALAHLFKRNHADIPRLYMADLLGAGLGVVLALGLMNWVETPAAATLVTIPALLAAAVACRGLGKALPLAAVLGVFALTPSASNWLEMERQERAPVIYKHWDALAKIKIYDYGGYYRGLNIDNVANSPVIPFDGDWSALSPEDSQWDIDVGYLVDRFDSCSFLSLGSGGGMDVFQAIEQGATEIHAVEMNGHINHMMLYGDSCGYIDTFSSPEPVVDTVADSPLVDSVANDSLAADITTADSTAVAVPPPPPPPPPPAIRDSSGKIITLVDYSGRLYHDPRVHVVTEDARTYVRRFEGKFDLIYSVSSNTWAALGSGAFALAENYLFTTEAFADYWRALSDSGFLSMEHQVYMPRLVTEVMDALRSAGVDHPTEHFAVYNLPGIRRKLLLISKQPLTDELRYHAFGPLTAERHSHIHLLYPAPDTAGDNLYGQIIRDGWKSVQDTIPIDLSPSTDDRPFVAQMGMLKNLSSDKLDKLSQYAEFTGFPMATLVMLVILAIVLLIVVPANLLPYLVSKEKLAAVPWLYYFTIGMAFMMVEIVLIQKYALFVGASIYSIATVLVTLLIASGLGSRFSRRLRASWVFSGIAVWILLEILILGSVTDALVGLPILFRAFVSALLVFPLGFLMGMPFPKATLRVGELVDWGFAVNGAASVLGSIIVVLIAISWGFSIALAIAGALYLLAYVLYAAKSAWR